MWTRPVFHTGASWSLPVVDWIRVAHIKCPVFVNVKYYLLLSFVLNLFAKFSSFGIDLRFLYVSPLYLPYFVSFEKTVYVMVFNATFNNISVIPWRSVLLRSYRNRNTKCMININQV
jgi:hypothetical protein